MPIGSTIPCNGCFKPFVQHTSHRWCRDCIKVYARDKQRRSRALAGRERPCRLCGKPYVPAGKGNHKYCGPCRSISLARRGQEPAGPSTPEPLLPIETGVDESTATSRLVVPCGPTERALIDHALSVIGSRSWIVRAVVDAARAIVIPVMYANRKGAAPDDDDDAPVTSVMVAPPDPRSPAERRAAALARGAQEADARARRARVLSGDRDAI
jgi:hypothetical protein